MNSEERLVLHVGKFVPPPYAGVEAHVDQLLRVLQPTVPCALVAAASPNRGADLPAPPYKVLLAPNWGRFASATISPQVLTLARRKWRAGRVRLLHVHAPNPWGDLLACQAPRTIPVVLSWHSDIVRQRRLLRFYRPIQAAAARRADCVVVPTPMHYEGSRQLQHLVPACRVAVVPYGIDVEALDNSACDPVFSERLRQWADGRPIVATVGRHVYYKGYEYLLQSLQRWRQPAVLVMVGTGVLTDTLKAMARELGVENRVWFAGELPRPEMVEVLRQSALFTLPSVEPAEAFGIASAEAMALGRPTVVCRLGTGVDYLNRDGETSLLVPPRDVDALARAIDTLLADGALRAKMGAAAREWVRSTFSLAAMRDAMLAVYRSLW
jgi:rhamnosyl/mannosyltransferase